MVIKLLQKFIYKMSKKYYKILQKNITKYYKSSSDDIPQSIAV